MESRTASQQQQQAAIAPNSHLKQARPASQHVESHSVCRRLWNSPKKKLVIVEFPSGDVSSVTVCIHLLQVADGAYGSYGDPGISAFPDGDNIFSWIGTIKGSSGTVYEGLLYKLSLRFPTDYPFKPPTVKFETMCFHPNVDQHGNICLDILQDKWSSAYDVRTILLSIQSLLGEPNNDSPLNSYAADLWSNQEEFQIAVQRHYRDVANSSINH